MTQSYLSQKVSHFGETIFAEMTALSQQHQAINLGQGFPNFPCPDFMKEAAIEAIQTDQNQYARGNGTPNLVNSLASFYSPLLQKEINPFTEITVTVGATEALFAACQGLLDPGDEVILFEPVYDSYPAAITMAGATPVYLPLTPNKSGEWEFSAEELSRLFNNKTKLIFINTPHNPTGKVFSREELQLISELCQKYDTIAICDEVYEHIIFEGKEHLRLATFDGMWERTITISSAGKTFSVTGWKIGWVIAPQMLVNAVQQARQWISFSVATPFQEAVAKALPVAKKQNYFQDLAKLYEEKRDYLVAALKKVGFTIFMPLGTYFVIADGKALGAKNDIEFCRYLTTQIKVTGIPPSFFYSQKHQHLAQHLIRFSFCKDQETLTKAVENLAALETRK